MDNSHCSKILIKIINNNGKTRNNIVFQRVLLSWMFIKMPIGQYTQLRGYLILISILLFFRFIYLLYYNIIHCRDEFNVTLYNIHILLYNV
jgi:hypothetical protein